MALSSGAVAPAQFDAGGEPDGSGPDPGLAARIARFRASYDPAALWPGLDARELSAALHGIESIARALTAQRGAPALAPSSPADLYALRIAAYICGTGALLGRWIADGRLEATANARDAFTTELRRGRERAARIALGVVPAFDALLARGITPVVLKGFHTTHAYWEEPGLRPVADVDVMIPAARIVDMEQALRDAGFIPTQPPPRAGARYKRHWRAADVDPRHYSLEGVDARSPWELDIHSSLDRSYHG